ncbi:MAG: TonB-dependent receptor [Rhodospirillaceae bacterium]
MSHRTPALKAALYGSVALFSASLTAEAVAQQLAIEEITVTARKRSETLLEIPIAVSAFSQADIDAAGINTLEALSAYTPGFDFQNVGQGGSGGRQNPNIRFRGLGVQQESPASRAGAVFWNGGYISAGAGILPLIDLERVEVIKGPQNAFFGRNTFAGAVNYLPARPGDEFSGKGSVSFSPSDQDSYNVTAAAGAPISDTVGVRLAVMQERVGADWNYDNGDPAGEENTTAITAVTTWEPTETSSFMASGFYVKSDDTRALQSQVGPFAPGTCNITFSGTFRNVVDGSSGGPFSTDLSQHPGNLLCGIVPDWDDVPPNLSIAGEIGPSTPLYQPFSPSFQQMQTLPPELEGLGFPSAPDGLGVKYKLWRVDLSGDVELPNDHTLSAEFARGESSNRSIVDNNFGTPALFGDGLWLTGIATWVRDTYAEIRVTSGDDQRLRYTIGTSYYKQDQKQTDYSAFFGTNNLEFQTGENIGIFGSLDYDITQQLTLSLEGRWNEDTQTLDFDGVSGTTVGALTDLEQKYDKFMPRVILSYQPTDDVNLYASWSKSYLQGIFTNAEDYQAATGFDLGLDDFTPIQALSAYEVGFKQRLSGWMNYSVAGYYMDWKNQTFFELSPAFVAANLPGDSEIYGIDAEADITPVDWFNLRAGVSYNHVEFTDFAGTGSVAGSVLARGQLVTGQQIDATGNRPRYMPKWTGSFSATVNVNDLFAMERAAWVRLDGIYQGQFYTDNFEYLSVADYWKFNARAGMDLSDNFSVEVYGNNLTNDLSWTTAGGDTSIQGTQNRKTFGPLPRKREFGLKLLTSF